MLELHEARQRILAALSPTGRERVMLSNARGRILAEDVASPDPHPAFDNSAMDGYAVRWDDVAGVASGEAVALDVTQDIPAGSVPSGPLSPGQAARVMTGGPLPPGADTVVMREDTDESNPALVRVQALPQAGRGAHIRACGENIGVGQTVLEAGVGLNAGALGLLALVRRASVVVARKPVVGIVSTGDELVELGQTPGPGQLVNSSGYMVAALVEAVGGEARRLPIAPDRADAIEATFRDAAKGADLVVSIGGVSAGDYDVVREVIERLCDGLEFWKIRMKPGKPLAFGKTRDGGTPLLGLPGNPVSTYVTFWQFVAPTIWTMLGARTRSLPTLQARLTHDLRSTPKRLDLQRGTLQWAASPEGGRWDFTPFYDQRSGNPMSLVHAHGLAHIPIGVARASAGDLVTVERLPDGA